MAERSNAAVLKTVEGNTSGGSNPSLSAFARRSLSEGGHFKDRKSFNRFKFISAGYGGQGPLSPISTYRWYYVYSLELNNKKHYVGCTTNIKERVARHLKGYVPATKPHRPLKLLWYCSFPDRYKAYQFERYLKSGSGRAFTIRHLL